MGSLEKQKVKIYDLKDHPYSDSRKVVIIIIIVIGGKMDQQEVITRFTYHSPKDDQFQRYEKIRAHGEYFATYLLDACPESRERSLAITKMEEAIMWANAAIARRE